VLETIKNELLQIQQKTEVEIKTNKKNKFPDEYLKARLLFLFQCDLLPGIQGSVLQNIENRDKESMQKKTTSTHAKVFAYFFILIVNAGMLFYIFLFAINESNKQQNAWLQSFLLCVFSEVFLSSTQTVFLIHFLIPTLVLRDVSKIQKKMIAQVQEYKEKIALKKEKKMGNNQQQTFNAAKYFFLSTNVARFYPQLQESEVIASFSTPFPKQSYRRSIEAIRQQQFRPS
jgi:hypothetical protein